MTGFGRHGALLLVFCGAALLFVDGLRSPPGLWYATAGIVAGTMIILYTVISSRSSRQSYPAPEPASSGTSEESSRASTTRQTESPPADTEQTTKSTETVEHESKPASCNELDLPELPTLEKSKTTSTVGKKSQNFSDKTQSTQRTSSYTSSSRTRKTPRPSTHRQRPIASTATPNRNHSTGTDNSYFKPVDSNDEINLVQIDTKFSYIDIDWGPELIGLDPVPDLVEVDVGPSAVSHELVRSPVEINISSFLKDLLASAPRSSGTAASNDSVQPSTMADNHARRQTDDTATRRRSTSRDTSETRYREQNKRVDRRCEPLTAADTRQQPAETGSMSFGQGPENRRQTTAGITGYGSLEEMGTFDGGRYSDRRSLGLEPVMDEEPIGPQEVGVANEPAVDMGMNYSPPRWEPPQWDADPFGLNDIAPRFAEPEESVGEPVEQPELGFGMSNWEPGVTNAPTVMNLETGTEMLGLDGIAEPPEDAVGLPGFDVENGSNLLFPEPEGFFPEEDVEDDWLTF